MLFQITCVLCFAECPALSDESYCYGSLIFKIKAYYPDLGIIPDNYDNNEPGFSIPDCCYITDFEPELVTLINDSLHLKKSINDQVREIYAVVDWAFIQREAKLKITSCLKYSTPNVRNLAQNWSHNIFQLFQKVRINYAIENFDFTENYWIPCKEDLHKLVEINKNDENRSAVLTLNDNIFSATIIGWKSSVEELKNKLTEILQEVQIKMNNKENTVNKDLRNMKWYILKLMLLTGLHNKLELKCNVKFDIDDKKASIRSVAGLQQDVAAVLEEIINFCYSTFKLIIDCSKSVSKLITHDVQTLECLQALLNNKATFYAKNDCVKIVAVDEKNGLKAREVIKQLFTVMTLTDEPSRKVLETGNWHQLENAIILNVQENAILEFSAAYESLIIRCFGQPTVTLQIDDRCETLTFCGIVDVTTKAQEYVRTYINNIAIVKSTVNLPFGVVKYLQEHDKGLLDDIEDMFPNNSLRLQTFIDSENAGIRVIGLKNACELITKILPKLEGKSVPIEEKYGRQSEISKAVEDKSIVKITCNITNTKRMEYLSSKSGRLFMHDIEQQLKVVILDRNGNHTNAIKTRKYKDLYSDRPIEAERFQNGVIEIISVLGDIVNLEVDVLVNPANGHLRLGKGVAGAMRAKGQLKINSNDHVVRVNFIFTDFKKYV